MPRDRRVPMVALLGLVLVARSAAAACDPSGADASTLAASRAAVDAACPCDGGLSRREYRTCAKAAIDGEIAAARLPKECRREALRYPRKSRCGRAGAVVCCRIAASGRERHRVASEAARCRAPSGGTACVSTYQSTVTGCDASGCVAPPAVCGNSVVEAGEDCDPPDGLTCDFACQAIECEETIGACGDGDLDPGEACEPPGTATCDRSCQPTTCPPAPAGETRLACLDEFPGVSIASNGNGYLAVWSARLRRSSADVVARRLDESASPIDAGPLAVSEPVPCGPAFSAPAVTSDGSAYGIAWYGLQGFPFGGFAEQIWIRELMAGQPTGAPLQLASHFPIGQCRSDLAGPLTVTAVSSHRYGAFWRDVASCYPLGELFETPVGRLLTLPSGSAAAGVPFSYAAGPPPGRYAGFAPDAATLASDTLVAVPVAVVPSTDPLTAVSSIDGAWVDPVTGSLTRVPLGAADWSQGFGPTVTAGDTSFLVAWADRLDASTESLREIRGRRVTRAAGPLDADGGLSFATTADSVLSGPAVAFDGTAWLVVWIERNGTSRDLKAVTVRTDGTVAEAPRLLASDVWGGPAVASSGGGTTAVLFTRAYPGAFVGVHTLTTISQ